MSDLKLEAVYYSSPFPRSLEALTILGLVFDRIHLPYVSLPDDGYAFEELEQRRDKLIESASQDRSVFRADTVTMINALQFTHWKEWTKDFLYYPHAGQDIWSLIDKIPDELPREIHDLTFPPRPNWEPMLASAHTFGVALDRHDSPSIAYPGSFHYPAAALVYAAENQLPIINDVQMLGMPHFTADSLRNNASALASILAVECIRFVLPQVPLLDVTELLDFRDEMKPHVDAFRRALLRAAASLNTQIASGVEPAEIEQAARFVVETEIQPMLSELRAFAEAEARPWHKRILGIGRPLTAMMSGEFWSLPPSAQLAKVAQGYAGQILTHEVGIKQKEDQVKRSPMFYLLEVERLKKVRGDI